MVRAQLICRVADHMCRMALMAMMIPTDPARPLNIPRCVMVSHLGHPWKVDLILDGTGARSSRGSVRPLGEQN